MSFSYWSRAGTANKMQPTCTPSGNFSSSHFHLGLNPSHSLPASPIKVKMEIDNDLQCPICLELYTFPIILPCSHVLCRRPCAETLFEFNFIRCPVCRDNCYVSGGISSLPRVIALENIIERYKNEKKKEFQTPDLTATETNDSARNMLEDNVIEIPCENCPSVPPKRAKKFCLDCNASLCGQCLRSTHPNREPFTSHELVEPGLIHSDSDGAEEKLFNSCQDHGHKVTCYCQLCKHVCCAKCKDSDMHKGHQVTSLEEAYRKLKSSIQDNSEKLQNSQGKVLTGLKLQKDGLKDIQQLINRRRDEINMQCDALLAEIENKRSFFLADLEYEERVRQNDLDDTIKTLEKLLGASQGLQSYVQEVSGADKVSFLEVASTLNDRLVKASLDCESVQVQPLDLDMLLTKVVDCRKEQNVLRDLHYLSAPSTPIVDVTRCARSENSVVLAMCPPNSAQDVVDQYEVHFCSEEQKNLEIEETVVVKNVQEDRHSMKGMLNSPGILVILIENLCRSTSYYFCLNASNNSGKSASSEVVQCTTLGQSENVIPVPVILEPFSKRYTSSIQIYSSSPLDVAPEQKITHYLLFRPSAQNCAWRCLSLYGRKEHRVFGLEPNTEYDFLILACNLRGECRLSEKISLHTEQSATYG